MDRKGISVKIQKELLLLSGGLCSICKTPLISIDKSNNSNVISNYAHIRAVGENGPRYNNNYPKDLINSIENIIVVCANCHKIIDNDVTEYTVERLTSIKENHERETYEGLYVVINRAHIGGYKMANNFEILKDNYIEKRGAELEDNLRIEFEIDQKYILRLKDLALDARTGMEDLLISELENTSYKKTVSYWVNAYGQKVTKNIISLLYNVDFIAVIKNVDFDDYSEDVTEAEFVAASKKWKEIVLNLQLYYKNKDKQIKDVIHELIIQRDFTVFDK